MNRMRKIEIYLKLPSGSLHEVTIKKKKLKNVIEALSKHGVILDEKLRISNRKEWHKLCIKAGSEINHTGFDDDQGPIEISTII